MALVLKFNGQQVGTVFKKFRPASHLTTPPARKIGLFHQIGDVNSDTKNLLYAFIFHVAIKGTDNIDAVRTVFAIQNLLGQRGDITIQEGSTIRATFLQYTIDDVPAPELGDGHGGRFTEDMTITAVGHFPPSY